MKPTCSVCMQPYVNQTFLQPCYHSFCFSCARQWINISPTCPLCKQDVRSLVYDICEETSSFQEYILAFGRHGKHNPPPKRRAPTLQEKARMFRARVYETEFATITYPAPLGRFASMTRIEPVHIAKIKEFLEKELPLLMHSDRDPELEQHIVDILQRSQDQHDPEVIQQLSEWLALGHNKIDPKFLATRFMEELYAFLKSGQQYWTFISKAQYQPKQDSSDQASTTPQST